MGRHLALVLLISTVAVSLAACGTTPEPTEPPPTQTPWIIVVTATPGGEIVAEAQPTQTPWIVVATPTARRGTTPTAPEATSGSEQQGAVRPTGTEPPPTVTPLPTVTRVAAEYKYPPPTLREPPNDRPVSWKSTVLLEWNSVGPLASDEYYHLHLERRPTTAQAPWYGDYVFTKENRYVLGGAFLDPFHPAAEHGSGVVYWWVRVVRKTGEDQDGKPVGVDISPPSEERTLILEPKPEDS